MWPSCAWFMAVVLALAVCCGATNVNKRPLKAEAVQTSTLFPTIPRDVPHIAAPLLAINFTSDGNARLRGTAELLGESFLAASGPVDPDRYAQHLGGQPGRAAPGAASAKLDTLPGAGKRPHGRRSLAICPEDPPLYASEKSEHESECRAYIYRNVDGMLQISYASAWFVDKTHVVTAAHAIAEGGSHEYFVVDYGGAYGIVCCDPDPSGLIEDCAYDARFYIVAVVAPEEWLNDGDINVNNDGAVLKVLPYPHTNPYFGVPLPFGSISQAPCNERAVSFGGFPTADPDVEGCYVDFQEMYRYTYTYQAPDPCPPNGNLLGYEGSVCPGMSGGTLQDRHSGAVVGIIVGYGWTKCSASGYGYVAFTQLVDTYIPGGGGISVADLIAAIS